MAALVIENGTLVAGANSYVTIDDADLYFEQRGGGAAWLDAETEVKEQSLVAAFDVMELVPWRGAKRVRTQPAAWPRNGAFDCENWQIMPDQIPDGVKFGQTKIALAIFEGRFIPRGLAVPARVRSVASDGAALSFEEAVALPVGGSAKAPATDDFRRVCGPEMLCLTHGVNRSLAIRRA